MNPIRRIYTFFHKNLLTKTMAIGVVLALMGTTCLIQLANIQLVNGKGMAQAAAQSRTTTVTLKARRGKIMDTNGAILAQSVERYTIIGNPEQAQAFIPTTCTKQTGSNCHQINGKPVGTYAFAAAAAFLDGSSAGPRIGHGRHGTGRQTVDQRAIRGIEEGRDACGQA